MVTGIKLKTAKISQILCGSQFRCLLNANLDYDLAYNAQNNGRLISAQLEKFVCPHLKIRTYYTIKNYFYKIFTKIYLTDAIHIKLFALLEISTVNS